MDRNFLSICLILVDHLFKRIKGVRRPQFNLNSITTTFKKRLDRSKLLQNYSFSFDESFLPFSFSSKNEN